MNYIVSYLLIVFSGFYLFNTQVKPVYLLFCMALYMYITFTVFKNRKIYITQKNISISIFILYLLISQLVIGCDAGTLFNIIMSFITFLILTQTLRYISVDKIKNMSYKFIDSIIVLTLIDTIYRFINISIEKNDFYKFKENSLLFEDSNFVGIMILSALFFCVYLNIYKSQNCKIRILILTILCLLTFSRAAIIAAGVCLYIYLLINFKTLKSFYKALFMIISIIILIKVPSFIIGNILGDASFNSKFYIIERVSMFLSKDASVTQILFGVGVGNAYKVLGIGAHNIIFAYLIETGIIGLSMYFITLIMIIYSTKRKAAIVIVPLFIAGLSLSSLAMPFMYVPCAIIYIYEKIDFIC